MWIQVGLGRLAARRAPRPVVAVRRGWRPSAGGSWSGCFGEAFGGIFAPGATWLFGAPGAVLFYCVAGVLIALPERAFATPRLGRIVLGAGGVFLIGMALLQAWPGRGFWQGRRAGTLTGMVRTMAQTPQPGFLSSWIASFASFDAAHGWAVNLFAVVALAAIGVAAPQRPSSTRSRRAVAFGVLCLADWVLVEDLGFLGGVGTDPNSMMPMALVFVAGYVAMVRLPVPAAAPRSAGRDAEGAPATSGGSVPRCPTVTRSVAAVGALAVVLIGTAPMATAAVNPNADPILTEALDGTPNALDIPAPHFTLTDQRGQPVSLASLRGHTVALTFLDPVCTTDCPLIAQEFRQTDQRLGAQSARRRLRRDRGQPDLPFGVVHERLRPPGVPHPPGQLVLPDRLGIRAPAGLELLRRPGERRRRRGDDRPQRYSHSSSTPEVESATCSSTTRVQA